jgi:hypothetical protein
VVEALDDGVHGYIERPMLPRIRCIRVAFDKITSYAPEDGQRATPLWAIRLVEADGPNAQYDGGKFIYPQQAIAAIDLALARKEPCERSIEIELRRVGGVGSQK